MELLIAFVLFLGSMALCLFLGITMLVPLGLGFVLFFILALRRGHSPRTVFKMAAGTLPESLLVIRVMLLIGCLTGLWRCCGTIAYFVSFGVRLMPPPVFLLAAFLLAAVMSYALGTSFGVSATCGVILMAVARAGGVNPLLAAGAVFSGVYVGDRGSPAASSAVLVGAVTGTDMRNNVRKMIPSSIAPFLLCVLLYGLLSLFFPMESADMSVLELLESGFRLHWTCLLPAILMLVLPFCGVPIIWSMLLSIAASAVISLCVQGMGLGETLLVMVAGYTPEEPSLTAMLSGGGALSMLEVCGILIISGTYGGIFRETGILSGVTDKIAALGKKIGRYPAVLIASVFVAAAFCNQTIGVIMLSQLTADVYGEDEKEEKMLDMENSIILTAAWVPWCIACSVPMGMMGVNPASALPFAFYPFLVPLCFLVQRHLQKKRKAIPKA